jgi:hypothetical protein
MEPSHQVFINGIQLRIRQFADNRRIANRVVEFSETVPSYEAHGKLVAIPLMREKAAHEWGTRYGGGTNKEQLQNLCSFPSTRKKWVAQIVSGPPV